MTNPLLTPLALGPLTLPNRLGSADAIVFARLFLANPDLPERVRRGASLNPPDGSTFYGGGAKGYTDYPALSWAE